ncbi:MAG: hypothetical protein WC831_00150 [Parcubacteria group bacterium]|jgi:hypothetical protein
MENNNIINKLNRVNKFLNQKSGFSFWVWLIIITLAGVKLFLVGGQHEYAIGFAVHDDRLFINQALNLMHLDWLGEYSNMTLAKGPFYPMWIALNHALHIPLLVSEHLLYIAASVVLVLGLKPVFEKRRWPLMAIYIIVLFNPVSFANDPATRVIREGIYQPLTLLMAALFIGLALRMKEKPQRIFLWSLIAGFALSAFWLTREEGVWLSPLLAIMTVYSIYTVWKEKMQQLKTKIFLIFLPFIILLFSINLVSAINYYEYGIYNVVEFKAPQFLSAYGSLTRVKDGQWIKDVPVSTQKRLEIYPFSPAFSELKPFLEGDLGKGWTATSITNSEKDGVNEIKGGWFMWTFRDAVAQAGYYSNGKKAIEYYQRLADEVNSACDQKKLDCYPKRASMTSPWNSNYNKPMLDSVRESVVFISGLEGFTATPSESVGDNESLQLFGHITYADVASKENSHFKLEILNFITKLYRIIMPFILFLSAIIFFITFLKGKIIQNIPWIIALSLLGAIFARIILLSIINVSAFHSIIILYLSPIYPLIFLFISLSLIPTTLWIEDKIISKNRKHEN